MVGRYSSNKHRCNKVYTCHRLCTRFSFFPNVQYLLESFNESSIVEFPIFHLRVEPTIHPWNKRTWRHNGPMEFWSRGDLFTSISVLRWPNSKYVQGMTRRQRIFDIRFYEPYSSNNKSSILIFIMCSHSLTGMHYIPVKMYNTCIVL